jgi:hypothetical protein
VSYHIISFATLYTIVATKALLLPLLSNFVKKGYYLALKTIFELMPVATFRSPVATCGEWQQGWTTLT